MMLAKVDVCGHCGGSFLCDGGDQYGSVITCVNCGWSSDGVQIPEYILEETLRPQLAGTRMRSPMMTKAKVHASDSTE